MHDAEDRSALEHLSDEALMGRVREGDHAALRVLIERHTVRLHRHVERRLTPGMRRRVAASDVLQEANLAAFEQARTFEDRGDGSFERWFAGIVENRIREAVQRHVKAGKRSVRQEVTRSGRPPTRGFAGPPGTPSQAAVGVEMREAVLQVIAALPQRDREILELMRGHTHTTAEVAELLGLSYAAVRQRYVRALARVEAALGMGTERRDGRRRPTR